MITLILAQVLMTAKSFQLKQSYDSVVIADDSHFVLNQIGGPLDAATAAQKGLAYRSLHEGHPWVVRAGGGLVTVVTKNSLLRIVELVVRGAQLSERELFSAKTDGSRFSGRIAAGTRYIWFSLGQQVNGFSLEGHKIVVKTNTAADLPHPLVAADRTGSTVCFQSGVDQATIARFNGRGLVLLGRASVRGQMIVDLVVTTNRRIFLIARPVSFSPKSHDLTLMETTETGRSVKSWIAKDVNRVSLCDGNYLMLAGPGHIDIVDDNARTRATWSDPGKGIEYAAARPDNMTVAAILKGSGLRVFTFRPGRH